MKFFAVCLPLTLALVLHAAPALAQEAPVDRPWSASISLGWDNPVGGNLLDGGIGTLVLLPAVIDPQSYRDVFGTGLQWRFGVGYLLSQDSEILGSISYAVSSGDPLVVGTLATPELFADFADHQELGLEVGYRRYLTAIERWRPYAGVGVGLAFVDRMQANVTAPGVGVVLTGVDFYDNTTAFTMGGNAGVLYNVNEQFSIGADLGLRWRSGLSSVDGLAGSGLERINDNSDRWTLPFSIEARIRF